MVSNCSLNNPFEIQLKEVALPRHFGWKALVVKHLPSTCFHSRVRQIVNLLKYILPACYIEILSLPLNISTERLKNMHSHWFLHLITGFPLPVCHSFCITQLTSSDLYIDEETEDQRYKVSWLKSLRGRDASWKSRITSLPPPPPSHSNFSSALVMMKPLDISIHCMNII